MLGVTTPREHNGVMPPLNGLRRLARSSVAQGNYTLNAAFNLGPASGRSRDRAPIASAIALASTAADDTFLRID